LPWVVLREVQLHPVFPLPLSQVLVRVTVHGGYGSGMG
jgi:hypothetical protein